MADPEHLELVRRGAEAVARFMDANPDAQLDLAGADLSGLDLRGARLNGANLAGANLSRANLREAWLNGADLRRADLRDADARGAALHRANFTAADIRGARFDPFGTGRQLMCVAPNTFQDARWDRERLEHILEILNLNADWEIRYQILPRS